MKTCKLCGEKFENLAQIVKHRSLVHPKPKDAPVPPVDSPTAEDVQNPEYQSPTTFNPEMVHMDTITIPFEEPRANFLKLKDAFDSIIDADSKAGIGRVMSHPQIDFLTPEEILNLTLQNVADADGRTAVRKQFDLL